MGAGVVLLLTLLPVPGRVLDLIPAARAPQLVEVAHSNGLARALPAYVCSAHSQVLYRKKGAGGKTSRARGNTRHASPPWRAPVKPATSRSWTRKPPSFELSPLSTGVAFAAMVRRWAFLRRWLAQEYLHADHEDLGEARGCCKHHLAPLLLRLLCPAAGAGAWRTASRRRSASSVALELASLTTAVGAIFCLLFPPGEHS